MAYYMIAELLPYDQVIRHPSNSDEFSPGYGFESNWSECRVYGPTDSLEEFTELCSSLIADGFQLHTMQDTGACI